MNNKTRDTSPFEALTVFVLNSDFSTRGSTYLNGIIDSSNYMLTFSDRGKTCCVDECLRILLEVENYWIINVEIEGTLSHQSTTDVQQKRGTFIDL